MCEECRRAIPLARSIDGSLSTKRRLNEDNGRYHHEQSAISSGGRPPRNCASLIDGGGGGSPFVPKSAIWLLFGRGTANEAADNLTIPLGNVASFNDRI